MAMAPGTPVSHGRSEIRATQDRDCAHDLHMRARMQRLQCLMWLMLGIGYPIALYGANAQPQPNDLGLALSCLPLVMMFGGVIWTAVSRIAGVALGVIAGLTLWSDRADLLAHYAWVSLGQYVGWFLLLASFFGATLRAGATPMVSRFLALTKGPVTPQLARYTRTVTWAWALFFVAMAGVAVVVFLGTSFPIWSVFANVLTMPIAGLMFLGEYGIRRRVIPQSECPGLVATLVAVWRYSCGQSRAHTPGCASDPAASRLR